MTLSPFIDAGAIIQIHAVLASIAIVLGPVALYRTKRDRSHKVVGYVWMLAMGGAALSSFGITSFGIVGPFSPIHLLAVLVLWSIYSALRAVIVDRNITAHQRILRSLYWNGLLVAGAFNFLPGRATNRVFFEGKEELGYVVLGGVIVFIIARALILRIKVGQQSPKGAFFA